jgi:anti-repressor protein
MKKILDDPDFLYATVKRLKEETHKRKEEERKRKEEKRKRMVLEAQAEEDRPYTEFARSLETSPGSVYIGEFAKAVYNSGINIGRNRMFRWLRDTGYLMQDNAPYQRYINTGYFEVKEYTVWTEYGALPKFTTYVTGKGQLAILKALRNDYGSVM